MPIKVLLEIRVEHPFYASGLCSAARVVPGSATASRLRGLRVMAKRSAGGLTLLADFAGDGATIVPITAAALGFDLLQLPDELLAATDLMDIAPGTVFTDAGAGKPMKPVPREERSREMIAKPAGQVPVVLRGRPAPGTKAADFQVLSPAGIAVKSYDPASNRITLAGPAGDVEIDYPVAPRPALGSLAAIEIGIGPDVVARAAAGNPRRFTIALKTAAAPWCYHLVTDLPNPLAEWRITHPAGDGPAANFTGNAVAEIAAADPADQFGSDLSRRSAPLRVLRFVSDAPVACSEARARRMALFAGDHQLFTALPNPSPAQVRLLSGKPAFGEVLRFVTT